jgi:RNA polymerase sigma factor (sigma-70 family)
MAAMQSVTADEGPITLPSQVLSFEERLEALLGEGFRVASAVLRDQHEAEDALQEAALVAWRKQSQLRSDGEGIRSWFLAIVVNRCRTRFRSKWWQLGRPTGAPRTEPAGLGQPITAVETRLDLGRALARLTWDQRAVLYLYFVLDLPQSEVARVLGIRMGTVKSRVSRAVARLRRVIEEEKD